MFSNFSYSVTIIGFSEYSRAHFFMYAIATAANIVTNIFFILTPVPIADSDYDLKPQMLFGVSFSQHLTPPFINSLQSIRPTDMKSS